MISVLTGSFWLQGRKLCEQDELASTATPQARAVSGTDQKGGSEHRAGAGNQELSNWE